MFWITNPKVKLTNNVAVGGVSISSKIGKVNEQGRPLPELSRAIFFYKNKSSAFGLRLYCLPFIC